MVIAGYVLGNVLGEGAFALTRIGYKELTPDQPVAVKSILRSHPRFNYEEIQKEIAIMQKIQHPRCVNLIEVHEDTEAVHMVEELGAGGELFDRIIELGSFCEKDAVHLIHQVVDGVTYLHSMGCVHRDLKPENLLMVGKDPKTPQFMELKICDFGLSAMRVVDGSKENFDHDLQQCVGTQEYLAPEVFTTSASHRNGEHYTGKIDVWAIGVIYYIMLSGRFPFMRDDADSYLMIKQICAGTYDMDCLDKVSNDSRNFITRCLTVNQDERPTAFEAMDMELFRNDQLPTEDLMCLATLSRLSSYKSWRKRSKAMNAVRGLARLRMSASASVSADPVSRQLSEGDKVAADLFKTIHAHAKGDVKGLEFYEIVLYMQDRMPHLFQRRCRETGDLVLCSDRVQTFTHLLRDKLDLDHDGFISQDEFIKGYCIWQFHIRKAEMFQNAERNASMIYRH